jgi:hypothetical protein
LSLLSIKNQRGESPVGTIISIVIGFMVLSLGMTLISNFQGNIVANPQNAVPMNSLWPLVVAGVLIMMAMIGIYKVSQSI